MVLLYYLFIHFLETRTINPIEANMLILKKNMFFKERKMERKRDRERIRERDRERDIERIRDRESERERRRERVREGERG